MVPTATSTVSTTTLWPDVVAVGRLRSLGSIEQLPASSVSFPAVHKRRFSGPCLPCRATLAMWLPALAVLAVSCAAPTPLRLNASRYLRFALFAQLLSTQSGSVSARVTPGSCPQAWPWTPAPARQLAQTPSDITGLCCASEFARK